MAAMHVGFPMEMILDILIDKSHRYFLLSFESTCLLVEEEKLKKDFQNGGLGDHLGFLIGIMLAIF